MTFSQAVQTVFAKYFTITGRASRAEFWFYMLFIYIVSAILCFLGYIFGSHGNQSTFFQILEWLFGVAVFLPTLAVTVRRLHDIGKGGGWIFIELVPAIGTIWLFILEILPSQYGDNRFGPQPA